MLHNLLEGPVKRHTTERESKREREKKKLRITKEKRKKLSTWQGSNPHPFISLTGRLAVYRCATNVA